VSAKGGRGILFSQQKSDHETMSADQPLAIETALTPFPLLKGVSAKGGRGILSGQLLSILNVEQMNPDR
jgi:hypothetical protein